VGPPSKEDLVEAVTTWGDVRNLATKENSYVPTGVITANFLNGATHGPEEWADKVDVACTDILRQCVANDRKDKKAFISMKINQRLTEHILSMEEGGRSSGFLRRAAFNGSTQYKHVQAILPTGGASTDGKDVINGLFRTYDDWFAARKAGPGGSSGAGRPDIMEVYEGLDSRLYRGSDKCVAYDIDL
jgi:hypothetical protein